MAEEIINGTIAIDEASQDAKQVKIKSGDKKFSFWRTKKDGASTKAYQSWLELSPKVGDTLDVQYKEEDAEWTKPDGNTVNFKRRTILQMRTGSGTVSTPQPSQGSNPASTGGSANIVYVIKTDYEAKIADMSAAFLKMQVSLNALEEEVRKMNSIKIEKPEGL